MHVYTNVYEYMYTYFSVCVWPNILVCRKSIQAAALLTNLLIGLNLQWLRLHEVFTSSQKTHSPIRAF